MPAICSICLSFCLIQKSWEVITSSMSIGLFENQSCRTKKKSFSALIRWNEKALSQDVQEIRDYDRDGFKTSFQEIYKACVANDANLR